jgi:hypothetical protein
LAFETASAAADRMATALSGNKLANNNSTCESETVGIPPATAAIASMRV